MTAEAPSLGVFTLSFTAPEPEQPALATEEHDATVSTEVQLENGTAVDVDPTGGNVKVTVTSAGRAHAGITLTRSEARELATALLDASAPSLADGDPDEIREHIAAAQTAQADEPTDIAASPSQENLHRYHFPRTRNWRGAKVPASNVHLYRTVDQRDVIEVEYVDTPEGPVMLIDGRRPISLDDTHRFMSDVALYRHRTDAVNAFIARREAGTR